MAKKKGDPLFKELPTPITGVSEFVTKALMYKDSAAYFRGQADLENWPLVPTVGRLGTFHHAGFSINTHKSIVEQEKGLLHRFRRQTYEFKGRVLSEWEALFVARHYDLPCRLLDWSSNPLVALYFAADFDKDPGTDGVVYCFVPKERKEREDYDVMDPKCKGPFQIERIRIIYPFYPSPRMTVQSGIFTIHSDPQYDLRNLSKAEAIRSKSIEMADGWKVRIPKRAKDDILKELSRLGINARSLFPELDKVAQGLIDAEVFRDPKLAYGVP